jgi:hypothetical protein
MAERGYMMSIIIRRRAERKFPIVLGLADDGVIVYTCGDILSACDIVKMGVKISVGRISRDQAVARHSLSY